MMRAVIVMILGIWSSAMGLIAQSKYDYTWVLGYNYTDIPELGYEDAAEGSILHFSTRPPAITPHGLPYSMDSNVSISDPKTGELLFYTNGCSITNKNHEMMDNGDGINIGPYHREFCNSGVRSFHGCINTMLILPFPYADDQYILFHRPKNLNAPPHFPELKYSVIDMSYNAGMGRVVEKNILIKDKLELAGGYSTAYKHADGIRWWIIVWSLNKPEYHLLLVDEAGISYVDKYQIGSVGPSTIGQAVFSPDGSTHMWHDIYEGVHIYDFDRETGLLSNHRALYDIKQDFRFGVGGVTISPNSRFAYLSSVYSLYQLDLEAPNLSEGLILIDTLLRVASAGIRINFSRSILAPDCKIYISIGFTQPFLHVIHNPDEKGGDCNLEKIGISLPFHNKNSSLPNNPHYRVDEEQICDPSLTSSMIYIPPEKPHIKIYPNPTTGLATLELPHDARVTMVSGASGQLIHQWAWASDVHTIDMQHLAPGLYIVNIILDTGESQSIKLIKMQ